MKKKLTSLILTAAIGLFAGFTASAASGDIYSITRCDENGVDQTGQATTSQEPFGAGKELYFKIRLQARDSASAIMGSKWYLNYSGLASELVAKALTPMQIGVYVSGRLDYATYVSDYPEGSACTAVIFKYVTKPGDFAMPIRLATATGPAGDVDSSNAYYFNPLRDFWSFRFNQIVAEGESVTTNNVSCKWTFKSEGFTPETLAQTKDYSLEKCGFYVQTVGFSDDAESAEFWRTVHENSTITGGGSVPKIAADAAPEVETTYYVWSDNEDAVKIKGGTPVYMQVSSSPVAYRTIQVGTITLQGGQVSQDFLIEGVAEGGTANIVLSAYNQYNYSLASGDRLEDFVTVPVKCIEPMPPSVVVECDRVTAIADADYTQCAAVLQVYLSQGYENAVKVTLTPQFTDGSTANWKDYLRVSTENSIDEPMADGSDALIPEVTIPANSTEKQTLYVFALRSDVHTIGTAKVKFQSSIDYDPVADEAIAVKGAKSINIVAATTAITAPAEGSKAVSTTCNVEYPFTITVSDTFADTHDAKTGYQIYINYGSGLFTKLDGYYYVGDGGALYKLDMTNPEHPAKTTEMPLIKYTTSGEGIESQVYVVAPVNPNTGTQKKSEIRTFKADVREARTVRVTTWDEDFTAEQRTFTEGDTAGFKIRLSEKNETGETIYAYLKPSANTDPGMFAAANYDCIIGMENLEGVPINNSMQEAEVLITLLDGYAKPGLKATFEIILSSDRYWDGEAAGRIPGYDSNTHTITINNVEPTIKRMEMNGIKATGDGYHFTNKLPSGQDQRFTLYVDDPGKYDLDNTNKPFMVRWTALLDGSPYDDPVEISGNPGDNPFTYAFPAPGEWSITAEVRDKDMGDWSEVTYTVYVTVLDQPAVEHGAEEITLVEKLILNDAEVRKFSVGVGYWDPKYNGELEVIVQVKSAAPEGKTNLGYFAFDSSFRLSAAEAEATLNALGSAEHPYDANSDYYYVKLTKSQQVQKMAIAELDGTDNSSIYGFTVQSFVINGDELPTSHAAANEYYLTSQPTKVLINNLAPEMGANTTVENDPSNAFVVAGSTTRAISWQVLYDVDRDFSQPWSTDEGPGVKITFAGCQNDPNEMEFFINDKSSGKFTPYFGNAQGLQVVTLTVEDKDSGTVTYTYYYMVEASKFLKTIASGPSGGLGTSLSRKYAQAKGRGKGHVWVGEGATLSNGSMFNFTWNCGTRTSVEVYGFGYGVGDIDDGTLQPFDFKVSTDGSAPVDAGPYYTYEEAKLDSYLYNWLSHTLGENGGLTSSTLSDTALPELAGERAVPTPVGLPSSATEGGSYVDTYVEAIFAKEKRELDNCGDINQDGIPDRALIDYDFGVTFDGVGDLADLSGYNDDDDYLPSTSTSGNRLVPNVASDWATQGVAFNAYLEIRGFGPGLNAGYPNKDGTSPAPDYTANEKRAWLAFKGLEEAAALAEMDEADVDALFNDNINAATADLAAANAAEGDGWSPERPTNPTEDDTDKDGLADGYEYWFWYGAKVGYYDKDPKNNGKWQGRMTGRRLDLDELDNFVAVSADDICTAFDPLSSAVAGDNDATRGSIAYRDFDNDGLYDVEEYLIGTNPVDCDTDNGGVPDGYEVMWGLNPLDNQDDAGERSNPDGDFMAYAYLDSATIVEFDADLGAGDDHYVYLVKSLDGDILEGCLLGNDAPEDLFWTIGGELVPRSLGPLETIDLAEATGVAENDIEGLSLIHNQVYQYYGYDPRTAWSGGNGCIHGYVAPRWCPTCNAQDGMVQNVGDAGLIVNTRAYTTLDEYLFGKYNGLDVRDTVLNTLKASCTNPNVTFEGKTYGDSSTAYESTVHGADTDENGVPDGWEAYVGYNPVVNPNGMDTSTMSDDDDDGLSLAGEYSCNDGVRVYGECQSIADNSSTTAGWFNRFFPTDPNNDDTDGDGLGDAEEGQRWQDYFYAGRQRWNATFTFIYGSPEDDGYTLCFRGGGMNPCSTDTDLDALPDAWEWQFPGIVVTPEGKATNGNTDTMYTDALKIADGFGGAGFAPKGEFIVGGMDATNPNDYSSNLDSYVNTSAERDFDFDFDGLQNYQEYLIQTVRAWRYDDTETPLMGRALKWTTDGGDPEIVEAADSFVVFDVLSGENMLAAVKDSDLWAEYGADGTYAATLDAYDYKALGYFAPCDHEWDPGYQFNNDNLSYGGSNGTRYMKRPQTMTEVAEDGTATRTEASLYATTDPRQWDSDGDGMDDFWEVFHGINPILGSSDLVSDAYDGDITAADNPWIDAGADGYDPVLCPWRLGEPNADPDGDGLRNLDEAINGNLTSPTTYHTDPSPLWMTEPTTPASYVSQYYTVAQSDDDSSPDLTLYPWSISGDYLFAFDVTEGYDTDGDWVGDGNEVVRNSSAITDPLNSGDPDRRAALYLPGEDACAYSATEGNIPVNDTYDLFRQFTVEAWIRPDVVDRKQTIVERGFAYPASNLVNADDVWRANFRLEIDEEGVVKGVFDNDNALESGGPFSTMTLAAGKVEPEVWTHVAMTFDGTNLCMYLDGKPVSTAISHLIPANGVISFLQEPGDEGTYPLASYQTLAGANTVGARRNVVEFDWTSDDGFQQFTDFFKGYIAEVRFWDGARTESEIAGAYKVRMTPELAAAEREAVYLKWKGGDDEDQATRSDMDGNPMLPPQLISVYNFQQLPAADDPIDASQFPSGFEKGVQDNASLTADEIKIGWWDETPLKSTVYADTRVVPYAHNVVSHLPLMDGGCDDTMFWSDTWAGYTPSSDNGVKSYAFPNGGNPYKGRNTLSERSNRTARFGRIGSARSELAEITSDLQQRGQFQERSEFDGLDDLVPLGGAYARIIPEYWDGQGASTVWTDTGADADGDGLADWWETLYGLDPNSADDWAATVLWPNGEADGMAVPAWEAYLRDVAYGMQPDGTQHDEYKSKADADGDGLIDWWQNLYALTSGATGDADGDGLSNYVEYMLTEVFHLKSADDIRRIRFAPNNAYSVNRNVPDYFHRLTEVYVGEIFTDHDRIRDAWEAKYFTEGSFVSAYDYDPDRDEDGDGWSNYAEFQAGTDPSRLNSLGVDGVQVEEYPIPTIQLTASYRGGQNTFGVPLVVKAWHDQEMKSIPDAVWTIGAAGNVTVTGNGGSNVVTGVRYIGMNPMREMQLHLSPGSVVPGSVEFEFKDLDWVLYNEQTGQGIVFDAATAIWQQTLADKMHTGDTRYGDIIARTTGDVVGSIDYSKGTVQIDFTKVPKQMRIMGDISGSGAYNDGNWASMYDLSASYVRVNWQSKITTGGSVSTYYLAEADARSADNNSLGHVKEGLNTFVAFYDNDGDGMYSPGEPYGFVRDIDVGWNYAVASIELTDTSVVAPRYKLTAGGSEDAGGGAQGDSSATDREDIWEDSATDVVVLTNNNIVVSAPGKDKVQVRIVRFAIDNPTNTLLSAYTAVLFDRVVDLTADGHQTITEADIMSDPRNRFDLDWNAAAVTPIGSSTQKVLSDIIPSGTTKMYYGVFLGQEDITAKSFTNGNMMSRMLVRNFDSNRLRATPLPTDGTLNAPAPTFSWMFTDEAGNVMKNPTYTAFSVRVTATGFSWTSDIELLPPCDDKGVYRWTPPLRVGAVVPGGTAVFEGGLEYTWTISVYNAKFKDSSYTSASQKFFVGALEDSTDYGTAHVAVRYYGPDSVITKSAGPIRVQAFTTPDFSGEPAGEGYVSDTSDIASTDAVKEGNAKIIGLKAGTYYIRAFIDTVNDGVPTVTTDLAKRTACWESWGCYSVRDVRSGALATPKSITVGPGYTAGDVITVYIDDCDTDGDSLPDAWEWSEKKNLTSYGPNSIDTLKGGFAMKESLTGAIEEDGSYSSGLAVLATRSLKSPRVAALILGANATAGSDTEVMNSLGKVGGDATAEPSKVAITSINLDRDAGTVTITTDTEGTAQGTSLVVSDIYELPAGGGDLTLTCKVLHCDVIGGPWTEIATKEVSINRTKTDYTFDLGGDVDLTSGFFKVTLEK